MKSGDVRRHAYLIGVTREAVVIGAAATEMSATEVPAPLEVFAVGKLRIVDCGEVSDLQFELKVLFSSLPESLSKTAADCPPELF